MALYLPSDPGNDVPRRRPSCIVIGGANGSGKSSLYEELRLPGYFVNADIIARSINRENPEMASLAAGKIVLSELFRLVSHNRDFIYETTLSSNQSISLIKQALKADYEVGLVFVALRDAELHVARVAQRVSRGGHNIPEAVIRRRYHKSMARLGAALRLTQGAMIFDNSELSPVLLLQIAQRVIQINNLDETQPLHVQIACTVAEAFDISIDTVYSTTIASLS